ncbi:MAG: phosphatidylserine decarboxylase [Planctomycetota bacterium]|nr:phosphatidylserine decarboxylase [Planctomycetota bacterium]
MPDAPAPILAPEGRPILAGFVVGGVLVSAIAIGGLYTIGLEHVAYPVPVVALLLIVWCAWFFRDPPRRIPQETGAFLSAADGRVCLIDRAPPPPELGLGDEPRDRVCVFMNVFDVHVNRAPARGVVERLEHRAGKFFNASFDKASTDNERLSMLLRLPDGAALPVVQIAGLVARRIVCRVSVGKQLAAGERYGMIRFGSRVDLYLPAGTEVTARLGQRAVAGETILARRAG